MPRRTKTYVIADENRDKGKMFLLTEMPALQAEKWAIRAFLALAKAGLVIPDDVASVSYTHLRPRLHAEHSRSNRDGGSVPQRYVGR